MGLSFLRQKSKIEPVFLGTTLPKNYTANSCRNYLSTGAGFLPSTVCPILVGWFAIHSSLQDRSLFRIGFHVSSTCVMYSEKEV